MTTSTRELETIFESPERAPSKFITADSYRTHYVEAGREDAHPLVLVHGSACEIGMGLDRWYPTILPLAEHFRVFAVDELGHGYTDAPRDPKDLAHVRVRAEHVIAFIEALGVGAVHLVGQSQGGWIVTYITLTRPDLVSKLVLVDSGSVAGSGLSSEGLPYFQNVFQPGTMIPKHDLKTREGIRAYVSEFCYDKARVTEELLDRLEALSAKWNDTYMRHIREFWSDSDRGLEQKIDRYSINGKHLNTLVGQISRPTLVVWGKQSNKGLDPGVALYKQIPGAQMHIFDRANHFVWLDQPRGFTGLVTWFLADD